jgi:hypothetical protein
MTLTIKQLNKLVLVFLNENTDVANLNELWMNSDNQKKVKNLLTRSTRPLKDPNAPKRGKSSYLYFCEANRDKVKKDLGNDAKATDITRQLGVLWNQLKNNKKNAKKLKEYVAMAEADKKRYKEEKEKYSPQLEKKGPKRAKSAYLYFCSEFRQKVKNDLGDNAKATNVTKELGVRWNALKSEGGTAKFDKLAENDRVRYQKEKDPKKGKSSSVNSEERTGYQVFCDKMRPKIKEDNPKARASDITKKLSAAWKALSKKEQESYK